NARHRPRARDREAHRRAPRRSHRRIQPRTRRRSVSHRAARDRARLSVARILVVDDEEGIRSFLAEALAADGHAVDCAASGEEAIRFLRAHAYDVALTDLKMHGASGMDVLRRAHDEQPALECIVLTAHGTIETAVEAMKLGAFDYLQKPLGSPAELRLVV